jgi:membrane-bound inhibitor of C-type lysozyme
VRRTSVQRVGVAGVIAAAICMASSTPASAQTFVTYRCGNKPVVAAFFPGERAARVQLDGHSMTLKQRIFSTGARYSKSGVTLLIKGKTARLKQRGKWIDCATE